MRTAAPLVAATLALLSPDAGWAADPADVATCESLFAQSRVGLHIVQSGAEITPINGRNGRNGSGGIGYDARARLYFVLADANGRPYRVGRETVWHVRTQTVARSAKADETILWRPGVVTQCSGGRPLDTFTDNSRFVSLQRYYDHHGPRGDRRAADAFIRRNFHFNISDPSRPDGCNPRTDDPETVGDLRDTYRFEEAEREDVLLARRTQPSRAVAATSKIFSGLSSELAHAASGEVACFGFAAPLPTRSTLRTQIFSWWRNEEAYSQAQTWQPDRTTIDIQVIPKGRKLKTMIVKWNN